MGVIADEHVKSAVVNRLKAMLDEPPKTKFNVTQSFALFTTIVLWTENRAWVAIGKGALIGSARLTTQPVGVRGKGCGTHGSLRLGCCQEHRPRLSWSIATTSLPMES
jgi:hypothetical protein